VFDDVLLVASELTTNAILHCDAIPGDEIELRAELGTGVLMIEVIDEGRSHTTPHTRPSDASVPGGFGLPVVAAIARRWGSERCGGLRVWAELAL
jgi:anti-sigma regulatory factor (Ser/Thr protein kinase)